MPLWIGLRKHENVLIFLTVKSNNRKFLTDRLGILRNFVKMLCGVCDIDFPVLNDWITHVKIFHSLMPDSSDSESECRKHGDVSYTVIFPSSDMIGGTLSLRFLAFWLRSKCAQYTASTE